MMAKSLPHVLPLLTSPLAHHSNDLAKVGVQGSSSFARSRFPFQLQWVIGTAIGAASKRR